MRLKFDAITYLLIAQFVEWIVNLQEEEEEEEEKSHFLTSEVFDGK
jgi:hypothetical protein